MFNKLKRLFGPAYEEAALQGAPAAPREKTHSAETGYVYQYFYKGYRETQRHSGPGRDYVFSVTADRKNRFGLTLFLGRSSLEEWARIHGRELTPTEQYALVKMSLFEAFDTRTDLGSVLDAIHVTAQDLDRHTAALDL